MFDREWLAAEGFEGFEPFRALREARCSSITSQPGVYAVLTGAGGAPEFLQASAGGHFKGQDPTVPIDVLRGRWNIKAPILYFGKASSLRARIRQFCDFGGGKAIGHWGGRYLWQIPEADNLLVAWRRTVTPADARALESKLLSQFQEEFGSLPFANLTR